MAQGEAKSGGDGRGEATIAAARTEECGGRFDRVVTNGVLLLVAELHASTGLPNIIVVVNGRERQTGPVAACNRLHSARSMASGDDLRQAAAASFRQMQMQIVQKLSADSFSACFDRCVRDVPTAGKLNTTQENCLIRCTGAYMATFKVAVRDAQHGLAFFPL